MARQVKKLNQKPKPQVKKLRVAAYVRVSMQSEDLLRSYARQVDYYTKLISNNPEWELAGIFSDRGITGTVTEKRDGFNEMLRECDKGNIDIILTKSISRFSRNTIDLLNTIRHLKSLGIEVRFEKENINSLSGDGELMLTILASFAQEESRSISENVKWGIRKRNAKGVNASGMRRIYGYKPMNGEYVVVEEEAEIVRRIFHLFNDGMTVTDICRLLNSEGLKTHTGREFLSVNVSYLLKNEMYIGDRLTNKFYVENSLTHRLVRNHGEVEQFYIEGDHIAIIDREDFEKAQQRFEAIERQKAISLPYHGIIFCGYCNSTMYAKRYPQMVYYVCRKRKEERDCICKRVREDQLHEAVMLALHIVEIDPFLIADQVQTIHIYNDRIVIELKNGGVSEWQRR